MNNTLENRLKELSEFVNNNNIDRLSVRMLDLVNDFTYSENTKYSVLNFRQQFNENRLLGSKDVNKDIRIYGRDLLQELMDQGSVNEIQHSERRMICEVRNIEKYFHSRLHHFHFKPISIELKQGQIVGLVGENGNGKTTLLRMISGELSADRGEIHYYENDRQLDTWEEIKRKVAFIPQRIERWFGTAEENLAFECALKGFSPEEVAYKVEFIIQRLGLHNFRELGWNELSSGYKLRFEIAKALVWDPIILILDEPLANLDIQAQEDLLNDLRNLADSIAAPKSIILSSQQLFNVETIADHVVFLKNGKTIHNGALSDIKNTSSVVEVKGSFELEDLKACFLNSDIKISSSASGYSIQFEDKETADNALPLMVANGLKINYFRDISNSTKRLFNTEA